VQTTTIRRIGAHEGQDVRVRGWLYNKREKGKLAFLIVRDGTGYLQAVAFQPEVLPGVFEACQKVTQESSLEVEGTVRKDDRAPGGYEMKLASITVHQLAHDYPISPKEHGPDFLLDHRHLWLRSSKQHALLRIRSEISQAIRDFFYERDFVLIDSPILTPAACEGTSTLFETDYFDQKAYLSQSGQLYLEPACLAFGKVYCFGPTFRAEKSKTRRHLTEFWMVEPEVAYAGLPGSRRGLHRVAGGARARPLPRRARDARAGHHAAGERPPSVPTPDVRRSGRDPDAAGSAGPRAHAGRAAL